MYILNKKTRKMHRDNCKRKPNEKNIIKLKEKICPVLAKYEAQMYYKNVEVCSYCCKELNNKK